MATRPLAFGIRFGDKARSVRVRTNQSDPKRYTVEVRRGKRSKSRDHDSLGDAVRDFASAWRSRLH